MSNDNPTMDDVTGEEPREASVEDHLKSRGTWIRLIFMLIYGAILSLSSMIATAIIVLGFFVVLLTGERNPQLLAAGRAVTRYIAEIPSYLTYNADDKPFPFGKDFPGSDS